MSLAILGSSTARLQTKKSLCGVRYPAGRTALHSENDVQRSKHRTAKTVRQEKSRKSATLSVQHSRFPVQGLSIVAMGALEPNNAPRMEAREMLRLVRLGVDTPSSAIALIRIPEKQKRFLSPDEIWYRKAVEAEFLNLLRPGTARTPERPEHAPPAPPQRFAAESAIIQVLKELMAAPARNLDTPPPLPRRKGPYRKRVPDEKLASEVVAIVARHYGVSVAALITPGRGPVKGSGLPRWTAVLLMREGGLRMREIVDCLGYCDATPCYQALHTLAAMRPKDPALDREISVLLESTRARNAQAMQSACTDRDRRQSDYRVRSWLNGGLFC